MRQRSGGPEPIPASQTGTWIAITPPIKEVTMYSILYIIGAIVVIVVVLRLLGLY